MEEKGVNWKKRLTEGRMKDVAFVLDPDGEDDFVKRRGLMHTLTAHRVLD